MYNIIFSDNLRKSIGKIPNSIQSKIEQILELLKNDPEYLLSESVKLHTGKYRYKLNSFYRLDFDIKEKNIIFEDIIDLGDDAPNIEIVKIKEKIPRYIIVLGIIIIVILSVLILILFKKSKSPNQGEQNIDTVVTTGIGMNSGFLTQSYRFFTGEQIINLIQSGHNFMIKGGMTENIGDQYPKIIVKDKNISQAILRIVVDFKDSRVQKNGGYVYGYSVSYINGKQIRKPAPGYKFSLKFGFGNVKNGNVAYGGWYNVVNYGISPSNKYGNNDDFGLNGAFQGKNIVGGREYLIDLYEVVVGNQSRKSDNDPMFKSIYPIEYLKDNLDKPISVSARLSDAGIWNTIIKEMDIIYVGRIGAIQKYE